MTLQRGQMATAAFDILFTERARYQDAFDGLPEKTGNLLKSLMKEVFTLGMVKGYDLGTETAIVVNEAIKEYRQTGELRSPVAMAQEVGEDFLARLRESNGS